MAVCDLLFDYIDIPSPEQPKPSWTLSLGDIPEKDLVSRVLFCTLVKTTVLLLLDLFCALDRLLVSLVMQ